MQTLTLTSDAFFTLQAICQKCRSATEVELVHINRDGVYEVWIKSTLKDPSTLSERFAKAGYRVNKMQCLGGDSFKFEMVLK